MIWSWEFFWPVNEKVDLTIKRSDTSLLEPTVKTQKKVLDTVLEDREDIDYYEGMIEKDEFDAITRASRTDPVLSQGHLSLFKIGWSGLMQMKI